MQLKQKLLPRKQPLCVVGRHAVVLKDDPWVTSLVDVKVDLVNAHEFL